MTPATFPESNAVFGPPEDLTEHQVKTVDAFVGHVDGGSLDGATIVVTAWKPTPEELAVLNAEGTVFLACIGGLPAHYIGTSFREVINCA